MLIGRARIGHGVANALIGIGELQVLERQCELAITLAGVGGEHVGHPAGRAAIRPGAHRHPDLQRPIAGIGQRWDAPDGSLWLDQQPAIEPCLLVGRRAEMVVREDRAQRPVNPLIIDHGVGPPARARGLRGRALSLPVTERIDSGRQPTDRANRWAVLPLRVALF